MKPNPTLPIGVFDSGVGGLTVLAALTKAMPQESFIYFGDTARTPYGTKTLGMVQAFASEIGDFLQQQGIKALVIACNTASAAAAESLRKTLPVPVIDVITPTLDAALALPQAGATVGVMGTTATMQSGLYQQRIAEAGFGVWAQACPLLAPMVEEGLWDDPIAEKVLQHYLHTAPAGLTHLILACTHYPILKSTIRKVLPGVALIDSAEATAHAVAQQLQQAELAAPQGQGGVRHIVSGDVRAYQLMASRFLFPAALVEGVNVRSLAVA